MSTGKISSKIFSKNSRSHEENFFSYNFFVNESIRKIRSKTKCNDCSHDNCSIFKQKNHRNENEHENTIFDRKIFEQQKVRNRTSKNEKPETMKRMQRFQDDFFSNFRNCREEEKMQNDFFIVGLFSKDFDLRTKNLLLSSKSILKIIISIIFIFSITRTNQHKTRRTLAGKS